MAYRPFFKLGIVCAVGTMTVPIVAANTVFWRPQFTLVEASPKHVLLRENWEMNHDGDPQFNAVKIRSWKHRLYLFDKDSEARIYDTGRRVYVTLPKDSA